MNSSRLVLPVSMGWPIVVSGLLAMFATYWDEAWHTEVGRDSAWAPPHVLLYGAVAAVGAGVAVWGVRALLVTRSLPLVLKDAPLMAAGLGGLGALVAAPIDAAWHEQYGRDAVLWSPPHMLVVLASAGLTLGVLCGLPRAATALRGIACVLLLANAVTSVFEYETGVPQFSEALYLPILIAVGLAVAALVTRVLPIRAPVATVVIGYVVLRLAIAAGLLAVGRGTPDLPIAVLGLALVDLPLRSVVQRYAAGAVAVAALAWGASGAGLASPLAAEVALTAVPVAVLGLAFLLLARRGPRAGLPLAVAVAAAVMVLAGPTEPARAHDPGQGVRLTDADLTIASDGEGTLTLRAVADEHCDDLVPSRVVARRAGATITGSLEPVGECAFRGTLEVPTSGLWFGYVELAHDGDSAEAWLAVDAGQQVTESGTRDLYLPAGGDAEASAGQIAIGALVYALGLGLLAAGVVALRRTSPRTEPVTG